jgi:hypothetical protein
MRELAVIGAKSGLQHRCGSTIKPSNMKVISLALVPWVAQSNYLYLFSQSLAGASDA